MKNLKFFTAIAFITLCVTLFSCTKTDVAAIDPPVSTETFPTVPSGERIVIHFGTSTQVGCTYSFTNCIYIGLGDALNAQDAFAIHFSDGNYVDQYFGDYFPLTADYTLDDAAAQSIGLHAQTIPAGFYPIVDTPDGKTAMFSPSAAQPVAALVNPKNPQDNLGQLHNLAMQVILNRENKAVIRNMKGDKKAIQEFVLAQTFEFLAANELPISATEQSRIKALDLGRDYTDYRTVLNESRLSAGDKKVLLAVLDEASAVPVQSSKDLSNFVTVLTNFENNVAANTQLDDPKMVLSTISVLKYSRYYWYWRSVAHGGAGTPEPAQVPNWVWADAIGFELGGPAGSIAASVIVYMNEN